MGRSWRWRLEKLVEDKSIVVEAAGRGLDELESRGWRNIDDLTWNRVVAEALGGIIGEKHVGLEATLSIYTGDGRLTCQSPAPVDVVGVARCKGETALLLIEVKRWSSWRSVVLQATHAGARLGRQGSISGVEALARCLDVNPTHLKYFGLLAYLLALVGDSDRRVSRDPLDHIASLTGYPRRRVYLVEEVRGPSQARGRVESVLREMLRGASCVPIT